eukprot:117002-Hanusia_phi.AAC.2
MEGGAEGKEWEMEARCGGGEVEQEKERGSDKERGREGDDEKKRHVEAKASGGHEARKLKEQGQRVDGRMQYRHGCTSNAKRRRRIEGSWGWKHFFLHGASFPTFSGKHRRSGSN